MKYLVLLALLIFVQSVNAQKLPERPEDCSAWLARIEKADTKATQGEIDLLLATTNRFCLSGTEFSEWLNELIYSTATKMPEKFLVAFSRQNKETKSNILNELKSPVHDGIDLKKAFTSIKSTETRSAEKDEILEAIREAGGKMGMKLQ